MNRLGWTRRGIAAAGDRMAEIDRIDLVQFGLGQCDIHGAGIVFEIFASFGTGNGNDIFALSKHPSERELSRRDALARGDGDKLREQRFVVVEVLALEARHMETVVAFGDGRRIGDRARQEATAKR